MGLRLSAEALLVQNYFAAEQTELDRLGAELEGVQAAQNELEEEHSAEDAVFSGFDKINDKEVKSRIFGKKFLGHGISPSATGPP